MEYISSFIHFSSILFGNVISTDGLHLESVKRIETAVSSYVTSECNSPALWKFSVKSVRQYPRDPMIDRHDLIFIKVEMTCPVNYVSNLNYMYSATRI